MKQQDFVSRNTNTWQLFENAIQDEALFKQNDMPKLYRQICHDLATAKARQYSPEVIQRINNLLLAGQTRLYKTKNRIFSGIIEFFVVDFKQSLMAIRSYVIWAHIIFYGVAITSASIVIWQPDSVQHFIDNTAVASIEKMYDPSSTHFAKERASDGDFYMFGHYIRNNISIAFQCFVGGILLGLGTLFYLVYNAIFFGAISGHIVNIDYGTTFFSFVITHGSFELTAIVVSAAAGAVIGKHLIAPGQLSRVQALKVAGKRTFPVILGCFILLIFAAFVEAFWSSSSIIPNGVKYSVGGLCWCWVLYFVFKRPKYET
ncbi:stage II sporulation protein M [Glaciecola petra]|uniref:Stage II sporulation protein M n=1 Tax=Glaciecola petra TaxID=3075602 RepID=A0ABU2ZQT0_9ALTE|nr:stage II sporulation protein M [Aestuariibacter sp. P117]MDT0594755.1 stage II sporulation protein M [Aestuariibacter sp. P117]